MTTDSALLPTKVSVYDFNFNYASSQARPFQDIILSYPLFTLIGNNPSGSSFNRITPNQDSMPQPAYEHLKSTGTCTKITLLRCMLVQCIEGLACVCTTSMFA